MTSPFWLIVKEFVFHTNMLAIRRSAAFTRYSMCRSDTVLRFQSTNGMKKFVNLKARNNVEYKENLDDDEKLDWYKNYGVDIVHYNRVRGRVIGKPGLVLRYLVEGHQLSPRQAQAIFMKMYNEKDKVEREFGSGDYVGTAGGKNGVKAIVTGTGLIKDVQFIDERISKLPQKIKNNFIISAVSDAINQVRILKQIFSLTSQRLEHKCINDKYKLIVNS